MYLGERAERERTAKVKGAQDAIARHEGRIQNKLDRSAGDAVNGEDGADGARVEAEAAVEVKRRLVVVGRARDDGGAEEDGDVLVVRDRVEGEKRVGQQRDDGPVGEDVPHGRRARGRAGVARQRLGGDERRRGLAVDKRRGPAAGFPLARKGAGETLADQETPVCPVTFGRERFL